MEAIFSHYGLRPDKNKRLRCPFHPDKKPSMQYYPESGTVYCFSGNCPRHGKSMDVIDLVMYLEDCRKYEAIQKCEAYLGKNPAPAKGLAPPLPSLPIAERVATLDKLLAYFQHGLSRSKEAQAYLGKRHLLAAFQQGRLEVGYNSGQFHHREGKEYIQKAERLGLLKERRAGRPQAGYQVWAKDCLIFPLRNAKGEVVSFYGRSIRNAKEAKHFYLKDRQGLFPAYPPKESQKVILTESIIDALGIPALPQTAVLALYGTNGLTAEHRQALEGLEKLDEIIFFLDGDEAGEKAVENYGQQLGPLPWIQKRKIRLSKVNLLVNFPGQDANSLLGTQPPQALVALLNRRSALGLNPRQVSVIGTKSQAGKSEKPALDTSCPRFWVFERATALYLLAGGVKAGPDKMRVSLQVQSRNAQAPKYRKQLDLYEAPQVEKLARDVSDKLALDLERIEADLAALTDALEAYREQEAARKVAGLDAESQQVTVPAGTLEKAVRFWKQPHLMQNLNALIGRAGVVGEEQNRLFLFGIASSYKMEDPLHALVQGSSGSGKTHLVHAISKLMPEEAVISLTRVTESSLYNYPRYFLQNKLVVLEDFDGMKEEAQFAWRELQSKGEVSSSTTAKDAQGNLRSEVRIVSGPIASMVATTHGEVYEDNMGRCFLIAIDESCGQTQRVIDYQNQKVAGQIDKQEQAQVKAFLQHCIRLLKPLVVVNPYAGQVQLPPEAHKIRRLNGLYQSYVKQITLLHQYQRPQDEKGRLITQKEDLQIALEIMFESIVLKVDELDGSLRAFFEALKSYVRQQPGPRYQFTQREVRQVLRYSRPQVQRYIASLLSLEYLEAEGHPNRGLRYRITWWDDAQKLREGIKRYLSGQLAQLGPAHRKQEEAGKRLA